MDKELVRNQLVGYWIATLDLRPDEVAAAKDIAANYVERIAQAAEEETTETTRDWCVLRDEAQVQAAVMAEELRKAKVRHLINECIDSSCPTCAAIDKAFSAAPKVVRHKMGWWVDEDATGVPVLFVPAPVDFGIRFCSLYESPGRPVDMFITEKETK